MNQVENTIKLKTLPTSLHILLHRIENRVTKKYHSIIESFYFLSLFHFSILKYKIRLKMPPLSNHITCKISKWTGNMIRIINKWFYLVMVKSTLIQIKIK